MRIFISYGHGDHTALVNALFDALKADGHEPWKDDRHEGFSGIAAGEDFTRVIYNEIDASDLVLAFVTARTMESPYCCDERQYAYNVKDTKFIQLRMDGVEIRLGNSRSYIDMDRAENTDGTVNMEVLHEKLQAIYAAFRDPSTMLPVNQKFERHLKTRGALQYEDFIAMPERHDFVGRQWLMEICKNWIMDDCNPCRLFVILGVAGTGKTAFVRHLASDRQLVRSVHVCIYDRPVTRNVRDTLKDLAYTLTTTNQDYFDYLKNRSFEKLDELDSAGLFEFLFLEPLKNEKEKYLLVIDGLDELEETTGLKPLIQLLRQYANKLNPNISILVTGRPDEAIVSKLRTISGSLKPVVLDKDSSREDLCAYIAENLQKLDCDSPQLHEKLIQVCDGNFEYLSLLFREARDEGLQLSGNMQLPKGLTARYTEYLDRRMDKYDQDGLSSFQKKLLAVMCVAYEPLPVMFLSCLLGRDEDEILDELRIFGSLVVKTKTAEGDTLAAFFSKGFRDYLLSGEFDQYAVKARRGTELLAKFVLGCTNEAKLKQTPYIDRHGFAHLIRYMETAPETVAQYLTTMSDNAPDTTNIRIATAIEKDPDQLIHLYFSDHIPEHQQVDTERWLKDRRAMAGLTHLVERYDRTGKCWNAKMLQGELLMMNPSPENRAAAEEAYRQALHMASEEYQRTPGHDSRRRLACSYGALAKLYRLKKQLGTNIISEDYSRKQLALNEEAYSENPCYQTRRDLAVVYEGLGKLCESDGRVEAEEWYYKEMMLCEENYHENPCYRSRRDLACSFWEMGSMARKRNTPEGNLAAENWYRKLLTFDEANYRENPCYESRRDLTLVYYKLGDMARGQNTPEGLREAENWYRKECLLSEENYRENPCYESRRSLSIAFERLGKMAQTKNTPEGNQETENWYRKACSLAEENYCENPCYESRRDLSIAFERLGDLARKKNTPEGNREAEVWHRKACSLDEENYCENPCYESSQHLSLVYCKLGDMAWDRNAPEGKENAEYWYRKARSLREESYRQNPCDSSWQNLSFVYKRLADMAERRNTPESNRELENWCRELLRLGEELFLENPCTQNYENLMDKCDIFRRILKIQNTPEARHEIEMLYRKMLALYEEYDQKIFDGSQCDFELWRIYTVLCDICKAKPTPEALAEAEQWQIKADKMNLFDF